MGKMLEELKAWMDSEEGQKSMQDFADKLVNEEQILNSQLERFHKLGNFSHYVEKIIDKYNSDEYRDGWYNRGFEPPETLYWFLFHYVEKYGRECDDAEWKEHANMFTSALYFYEGYYFNRMDGQGSVILIKKTI